MGRILLFDIDGTLLTTGGAGRRAMREAFARYTGHPNVFEGVSFGGMTDLGIARVGLTAAGREMNTAQAFEALELYLSLLPEALREVGPSTVFPGVPEVLEAVSGHDHVGVGIATGNHEQGAAQKLAHAGLGGWFHFGGYGSDHEIRAELVRIGAQRGAAHLSRELSGCEVIVIGDTPRDVVAAHAIGAYCLAVATGGYDAAALHEAGADKVVADLTDPEVLPLLLG